MSNEFTLANIRAAVTLLRKHNRPQPYGQLWWSLAPEMVQALVEAERAGESLDAACARLNILRVSPAQFTQLQGAGCLDDEEGWLAACRQILGDGPVDDSIERQRDGLPPVQYTVVVDGDRG